jgi:hypothetical protein
MVVTTPGLGRQTSEVNCIWSQDQVIQMRIILKFEDAVIFILLFLDTLFASLSRLRRCTYQPSEPGHHIHPHDHWDEQERHDSTYYATSSFIGHGVGLGNLIEVRVIDGWLGDCNDNMDGSSDDSSGGIG